MTTICCHNEIDIGEFSDTDILEEAAKIILSHRARSKPDSERAAEAWELVQIAVDHVAGAVGVVIPDERQLPPASTAARITSIEALRAFNSRNQQH